MFLKYKQVCLFTLLLFVPVFDPGFIHGNTKPKSFTDGS